MSAPPAIITGAAGWLGHRLARTMVAGLPDVDRFSAPPSRPWVRCLVHPQDDRSSLAGLSDAVEIMPGDVTDPATLLPLFRNARGATVFHCAGVIHPQRRIRELYDVNVGGTRNVLAAARAAGVRRFVHVSSNSPLGCNPDGDHLFDESSPYNPYMNYGRSKKLAEDEVNRAGAEGGLEVVIIRPPWFYGVGQPPRQSLFFRMVRDGGAPILGNGLNRRSMANVDNICQGLLLSESVPGADGETYWIADARPYSSVEIMDTIERLLETEFDQPCAHKRLRLPWLVGEVATWLDSAIQSTGRYHQKIHVLSEMNKNIACTIDKARRDLGYDPRVDLEEGMRRSLRWVFDCHGSLDGDAALNGDAT